MDAYIYQAALLCKQCAKLIQSDETPADDSNSYPQGPYPDGGGESDCPQHCDRCGLFLENPLTDDGVSYVREQFQRANPMHPPRRDTITALTPYKGPLECLQGAQLADFAILKTGMTIEPGSMYNLIARVGVTV